MAASNSPSLHQSRESHPIQFIWIGGISLQIGAMLHLLIWQLTDLSFTHSLWTFLGIYLSSATFLLLGLAQNRLKSKTETPPELDLSLMEFDSEWDEPIQEQEGIRNRQLD